MSYLDINKKKPLELLDLNSELTKLDINNNNYQLKKTNEI